MVSFYRFFNFLYSVVFRHRGCSEIYTRTDSSEIGDSIRQLNEHLNLFKDMQEAILETEYHLIMDSGADLSNVSYSTLLYMLLYRIAEVGPFLKIIKMINEKYSFISSFNELFERCKVKYTPYRRILVASYSNKEFFKEFLIGLFSLFGVKSETIGELNGVMTKFYCLLFEHLEGTEFSLQFKDRFKTCIEELDKVHTDVFAQCSLSSLFDSFDNEEWENTFHVLLTDDSLSN
ncbi:hypothetical protein THOM_2298 [Trachipleistophora hominis]|uniref:Uncharacterized protein n=1 Tax=Trachipleistophora hominis TaxID=72359 RepID=L7JTN1_TRAHO|nr:hypothetical protein THOM_2298 [Trachipleistophora hominis]